VKLIPVANCVQRHLVPHTYVCFESFKYRNVSTSVTRECSDGIIQKVDEGVVVDGDDFGDDVELPAVITT